MNQPVRHRARKRFGQHFLTDYAVVQEIVAAIQPRREDHLVEIGPGLGVLTEELLPLVRYMDAVELDRDIIPKLQAICLPLGQLTIHSADALKFDFSALVRKQEALRIVGNLPYNISTPLLFKLLEQSANIQDMHFMLQKEVVNRLAATPGDRDYGRLSVIMQYHCQVEHLFNVPPDAFSPPPKVDSAMIRLCPHKEPPICLKDIQTFKALVATAFGQRRKTLRNNLRGLLSAEQIEQLDIDPGSRAQTLSLNQFARLSNAL